MPTRRTVDIQDGDEIWTVNFVEDVEILVQLIEEAFVVHPSYLLSPVLRRIVVDKGREVAKRLQRVKPHIVIDNLGKPLKEGD